MYQDLYSKALGAAEAARDNLDEEKYDSAVNRAYYAMFNAARAFLANAGCPVDGSHGRIVQLFGQYAINTKKVDSKFGRLFNRAQDSRSVADYQSASVDPAAATEFVDAAEALVDIVKALLPSQPALASRGASAKEKADLDLRRILASTFCSSAIARGETIPAGLDEKLVLYGTRESLSQMIAEINEMNELKSFLEKRFPDLML